VAYAVAQISDLHIVAPGRLMAGEVDTAGYARAAVEHLRRLDPQADAVLATGDLVDDGRVASYEHLRDLVTALPAPLWILPGNHDDRTSLRAAFPGRAELGTSGVVQFVIDGPLRVVALDSSRPGEDGGRLDGEQLAWLDATLGAAPTTPTIVALHHPPFATGIGHMDEMALDAGDAALLGGVIDRHRQVERVQCGHLHRSILCRWHGTIAAIAPSVAHAVALDLNGEPAAWTREPPAFLLHRWTAATGLVTHLVPIGDFPPTPY
jgi:3',5'-cyclic AMP phosphodiesterase CpdA